MSPLPPMLVLPTCIRSFSSSPLQHGLLEVRSISMCTCSQGIKAAQHFAKLSLCISSLLLFTRSSHTMEEDIVAT